MPPAATLVVFAGAALLLLVIPGPAVLYIVTRSATQGRKAGLASVAGVHVGTGVHILAAVAGLSALIVASATAFTTVKVAGAAYLLYLGISTLRGRRSALAPAAGPTPPRSLRRVFVDGIVLNVLNPKTAVFFLAFVPQFVDPAAGNAQAQLVVLGLVFIGLGLLSDGCYALAGSWAGERITRSPRLARRTDVAAGTAYLGLGLVTAFGGGSHQA